MTCSTTPYDNSLIQWSRSLEQSRLTQSAGSAEGKSVKIRNADETTVPEILGQMAEPRPLPMNVPAFHEWADRIISGAIVPCEDIESLKFALASMIMHLGPHDSHKADAHFIHALRKGAINQVAAGIMQDIKNAREAKLKAAADSGAAKDNVTNIEAAKH